MITGFWTSQLQIEQFVGQFTADQLSNLNGTDPGASDSGFTDAILQASTQIDYFLALFGYPTSLTSPQFPTSSFAFPILTQSATILAAGWLYIKRGAFDDDARKVSGALSPLVKEAMCSVQMVIKNKIPDVPRQGYTSKPAIVLNPTVAPFGTSNPWPLSAGMIPELP